VGEGLVGSSLWAGPKGLEKWTFGDCGFAPSPILRQGYGSQAGSPSFLGTHRPPRGGKRIGAAVVAGSNSFRSFYGNRLA